jgi:hypothetical protein
VHDLLVLKKFVELVGGKLPGIVGTNAVRASTLVSVNPLFKADLQILNA